MNTFQIPITDSEIETCDQDFIREFYKKQCAVAKAAHGKKASELTVDERFAVAVASGAKIGQIQTMDNFNMVMSTEPCMIVDNEQGGFTVITRGKHPFDKGASCRFTE
jgi:hypothetical protein